MSAINIEAPVGTSINIATADQALVTTLTKQALTGVTITTDNNQAIALKDGSSGDTLAKVPANAGVGTTFNFLDIKFPDGIYLDAGGSATGVVTVAHWSYIKGVS